MRAIASLLSASLLADALSASRFVRSTEALSPRSGPKFVPTMRRDGQPLANLSRRHPDWGMTPSEHYIAKAERAAK